MIWGMLFEMLVGQMSRENIKTFEFRVVNWGSSAHGD